MFHKHPHTQAHALSRRLRGCSWFRASLTFGQKFIIHLEHATCAVNASSTRLFIYIAKRQQQQQQEVMSSFMTSGRQRQVSGLIRLVAKYIQAHELKCISTDKCTQMCVAKCIHMYSIMNSFSFSCAVMHIHNYLCVHIIRYVHKYIYFYTHV